MPLEKLRDRIHRTIDRRLLPLCRVLAGFGVRPNQITVAGTLVCLAGAVLVATDRLVLGGLIWLAGSALDMFDGALARSQNQVSRGGAFLDSTLDRISEGVLFTAIAYHFAAQGAAALAALTVLALLGALLVSYTRARAEALGAECKVGIITRAERVVLLSLGLVLELVAPVIVLLVVLGAVAVAQRIHHTLRELDGKV
ncbi:MAG: CDP-alcohol phosphatidyltransferase family protein [Alphaproteobacteria bacterium]